MEPISIRKLDKFYGQDRRIINTGLLRSEVNYPEEQISQSANTNYNLAKNHSRRSLLNYDGNSLFAGYGSSFYNPFFNKVFLNVYDSPNSPYYGYLHKTSRDIITLPVYSPVYNEGTTYESSEFKNNTNIWNDYIGKDTTMEYYGLFLRSDGHYIMQTSNIVDNNMNKENNASVFYYIPFYSPDMYDKDISPFNLCPYGYTNITIGPPDIFTIGQTYYALLDFEPYLFSKDIDNANIYCAIRMATKTPITLGGSYVYNRINTFNYINSCAYINLTNDTAISTSNTDNTRSIAIRKRHPNDYNANTNTLMFIKASANKTITQNYRSSMAVLLEWKWGLRNSPFSVANAIEEQIYALNGDTLSIAGLSSGISKEAYYCQFLEISARVVQGIDFIDCKKISDYDVDDIISVF